MQITARVKSEDVERHPRPIDLKYAARNMVSINQHGTAAAKKPNHQCAERYKEH